MTWQTVEAVCDCPHRLESWRAFIESNQGVTLAAAKEQIRVAASEHMDEHEHCNIDTVTMTVHNTYEVPV